MKYHIYQGDEHIASFHHKGQRDTVLKMMQDRFAFADFYGKDDK